MADERLSERPPEREYVRARHPSLITARLVLGLVLVVLGVLWTLDNLELIDARGLTRFWPAALLLFGLARLFGGSGRRAVFSGTLFTSVGAWMLLQELGVVPWSLLQVWPLVLIVLGVAIIIRTSRRHPPLLRAEDDASTHPRVGVVFGGARRRVHTQSLVGAEVTAVLGHAQLDLREARAAADTVVVDVVAVCGGVEILVPHAWKVSCEVVPVMGAVEDWTQKVEGEAAAVLIVRGALVMGGCELRTEPRTRHRRPERHARDHAQRG